MNLQLLDSAEDDLVDGYNFYSMQNQSLGDYFLDSLFSDIDSLLIYAGSHPIVFNHYRALSKRFPFAIYYKIEDDNIQVRAVLDCRKRPSWTRDKISGLGIEE